MPGHVAKASGPDPCPDQWLYVSDELKIKLKSKPYDPKKSCWVPDKTGGYLEGLIESIDGEKATVKLLESGDVSTYLLGLEFWIVNLKLGVSDFVIQDFLSHGISIPIWPNNKAGKISKSVKVTFPYISYYFHIPKIFDYFFFFFGKNRNRRKSNLLP